MKRNNQQNMFSEVIESAETCLRKGDNNSKSKTQKILGSLNENQIKFDTSISPKTPHLT